MVAHAVMVSWSRRGSSRNSFTLTTPGPRSTSVRKFTSLSNETSVRVSTTADSMIRPSPMDTSARGLMVEVGKRIGPDAELGLVAWREQHLLMADRHASDFGFRKPWGEQLQSGTAWLAAAPDKRWLLVEARALQPCIDRARSVLAGRSNRRDWWLVPHGAVVGACGATTPDLEEEDE